MDTCQPLGQHHVLSHPRVSDRRIGIVEVLGHRNPSSMGCRHQRTSLKNSAWHEVFLRSKQANVSLLEHCQPSATNGPPVYETPRDERLTTILSLLSSLILSPSLPPRLCLGFRSEVPFCVWCFPGEGLRSWRIPFRGPRDKYLLLHLPSGGRAGEGKPKCA